MLVYHGTESKFDTFQSEYTGKGNDQLGSGFYFTDNINQAKQYGDIILKCDINIENPLVVDEDNLNNVKLTHEQAFEIMKYSPDVYDENETALWNFIDISGMEIDDDVLYDAASHFDDQPIYYLENDFFRGCSTEFRQACKEVLGYDGIISHKEDAIVYVCWFPEQIDIIEQVSEAIEVGKCYKLKGMDFGEFIKDDDQNDYKVLKMDGDTCICQKQDETREVFVFNKDHLIDPEKPEDKYTKWKLVMEKLNSVSNSTFLKQLQEEGCGCAAAACSCGGTCSCGAGEGSASLGTAPTPALSHVSGAMVNGIPVAGKSVKKKKKKKHEDFDPLEVRQMLAKAQSEENDAIQSYLDKAKKCKELGIPALEKLFMELAKDETVHTGCLQGALANYELDNIEDVLDGEKEALDILEEDYADIVWRMDENFNEKYDEITALLAKQLDRMNFVYANTDDIIYKKEGEYKYLLKFDNEEGYLKFKVSKGEDILEDKEWKLEEGEDVSPIFNEIEDIYNKYGI